MILIKNLFKAEIFKLKEAFKTPEKNKNLMKNHLLIVKCRKNLVKIVKVCIKENKFKIN